MREVNDFRVFYKEDLKKRLLKLDGVRRKNLFHAVISGISIFLGIILAIYTFIVNDARGENSVYWPLIIIFGGIILAIPSLLIMSKKDYKKRFKEDIIASIIAFVSEDLKYFPEHYINEELFKKSRLFLNNYNLYSGDDLVEGKIDRTVFHFSELNVREEVKTNNGTSVHTVFRGMFFVADFNKSFEGSTVLLPNYFGGRFTFLKKAAGLARRERFVKLEDPLFMRNFNCYSDDDIKARYILSPALMQRLNDFRSSNKRIPLYVSFVDDHLYIAFYHRREIFEPTYFQSIVDYDLMLSYFKDIKLATDIVSDLNLNNRIWSKE
jgi:hypothetical protein